MSGAWTGAEGGGVTDPEGDRIECEETGGAKDRLLPWRRVQEIAGISRATAWRMQKTGDFPDPVTVSPNRVAWWESELTAWKSKRMACGRIRPPPFVRPREPRLIETVRSAKPAAEARTIPVAAPRSVLGAKTRSLPSRSCAMAPAPLQGVLALDAPDRKPRRRSRPVSADQIDFGF
jgi:prophage regulatory protein